MPLNMTNKQLDSLLFKPELHSLAGGKALGTFAFLILVYSLALFSMGSSQQVMAFLEEKMNDPFVEGISTIVPASKCDQNNIKTRLLENKALKDEYDIEDIRMFAKNYVVVRSNDSTKTLPVGCFDNKSHPLWEMLSSKPELFKTAFNSCKPFDHLTQSGVIISANALKELGHAIQEPRSIPLTIDWYNDSSVGTPVKLPILAVVESLPFDIDIAIRSHTWGALTKNDGNLDEANVWFVDDTNLSQITSENVPHAVRVPNGMFYSGGSLRSGMAEIQQHGEKVSFLHVTDTSQVNNLQEEHVIFSMSAEGLSKIRLLEDALKKDKKLYCEGASGNSKILEFEETKIVAKENLVIFKSFAQLLSAALVLITLILIVNYTGAVLRLHINNNKQNLGTLTAFGYPNKTIISLYLRITATILGGAFVVSYLLIWPLGYLGFNVFLNWFNLNERLSDVSFSHIPLTYSIPLFVVLPLVILAWRIQGQLKATPGDLVYDR